MATSHIARMGSGVLYTNHERTHPKAPQFKGTLMLSKDYKAGENVKISAWLYKTPKGELVSLNEDTWKPPADGTYPREVNKQDDNEVPF
jgi:hypothetical protein